MTKKKRPFNFTGLLLGFVCLFALIPFAYDFPLANFILRGLFLSIIFLCVYAVSDNKIELIIALFLASPSVLIHGLYYLDDSLIAQNLRYAFSIMLYVYVSFLLLRNMFQTRKIDADILYQAICVYLLMGIIWGSAYTLLELITPGSLSGLPEVASHLSIAEQAKLHIQSLFYYSYITLTTLGYGNIAPISPAANALASSEAIIGQLYIAILMARLVALHVIQDTGEKA